MRGGEVRAGSLFGYVDLEAREALERNARSTTDNDARPFRKAAVRRASSLSSATVPMENRNGLAVDAELTGAAG
jgi:hypothetical protein